MLINNQFSICLKSALYRSKTHLPGFNYFFINKFCQPLFSLLLHTISKFKDWHEAETNLWDNLLIALQLPILTDILKSNDLFHLILYFAIYITLFYIKLDLDSLYDSMQYFCADKTFILIKGKNMVWQYVTS